MYFSKGKQYWPLVRIQPHTCNHRARETEMGDHEFTDHDPELYSKTVSQKRERTKYLKPSEY